MGKKSFDEALDEALHEVEDRDPARMLDDAFAATLRKGGATPKPIVDAFSSRPPLDSPEDPYDRSGPLRKIGKLLKKILGGKP
jgi:hypothetical protein